MDKNLENILREIDSFNVKVTEINHKLNSINSSNKKHSTHPDTRILLLNAKTLHSPKNTHNGPREINVTPRSPSEEDPSRDEHRGKNNPGKLGKFEEFSGYTTLHGLVRIGARENILPRRYGVHFFSNVFKLRRVFRIYWRQKENVHLVKGVYSLLVEIEYCLIWYQIYKNVLA